MDNQERILAALVASGHANLLGGGPGKFLNLGGVRERMCRTSLEAHSGPVEMPGIANLADSAEITTLLLLEPLKWRVRVVEHVLLDSAHNCKRRRSVQCAPLREFLVSHDVDISAQARTAMIVLNVASVPRGPLMNFDVEGPLGSAYLLPRAAIAERQTAFLKRLAEDASFEVTDECQALLSGMVGMSLGDALVDYGTNRFELESYLRSGLNAGDLSHYLPTWKDRGEHCVVLLRDRVDANPQTLATLNPVMALPETMSLLPHPSLQSLDKALYDLCRLLDQAARAADAGTEPSVASDFLNSLADYAVDYDLMVATEVPLDEPFLLKYSERRDLRLGSWRHSGSQDLLISDAGSNHVVLEVADPNIQLRNVRATVPGSKHLTYGGFTSRDTEQVWTLYASDLDRDYRATLHFRARPTWRVVFVPYVVAILLALLALGLWHSSIRELGQLAIVAGPAALAASVLLTRDQSTLAARLRGQADAIVAGTLVLLLVSCILLYLGVDLGCLWRLVALQQSR